MRINENMLCNRIKWLIDSGVRYSTSYKKGSEFDLFMCLIKQIEGSGRYLEEDKYDTYNIMFCGKGGSCWYSERAKCWMHEYKGREKLIIITDYREGWGSQKSISLCVTKNYEDVVRFLTGEQYAFTNM